MSLFPIKTFVHPQKVYKLEYPAHWDQLQQDEAQTCGFGPHDRDNVGLWLSILPMSVDTDRLVEDLPKLMQQAMAKTEGGNMRQDETLKHYGLKADVLREGQGGHYWIVTGGDVVLFASTQVPVEERDVWNPQFERLMASLHITRDDELFLRKVANEVLHLLKEKHPDQDFQFDEKGIRGKNQVVFLGNLYREVRAAPHRRAEIIKNFVGGLSQSADWPMGYELLDEIHDSIFPMLKPRNYIDPKSPTQHLQTTEWLADVLICYVIKVKKFFRFVTGWDVNRWETTPEALHELSLKNLAKLPWPSELHGSRQRDGGRVIVVDTNDSLASSRILHPDLHRLFAGPLGNPFWAGIPDRNTLVVYSDRRSLKQRIARQLFKDYKKSAYPITARPFLITRDGIAASPEK
jgi:uncharacterized protein YtpQ (UPF0354 family)